MPTAPQSDAVRGTADLLILKSLAAEPQHGWGIAQRIETLSGEQLVINQGSLYSALQRLEYEGHISSDWGTSENGRRARYYRLTAAGRRALEREVASWRKFSAAVNLVLVNG